MFPRAILARLELSTSQFVFRVLERALDKVASGAPLRQTLERRLSWSVNERVGIAAWFVDPADDEPLRIGRGSRLRTVSRGAHLEECQVGREHPAFVVIRIVQKASHLAGTDNARFGRIVLMAQQSMSLVIVDAYATSCRTKACSEASDEGGRLNSSSE